MPSALLQQKLFQGRAWLTYWLEAVNEHSLHPPYVYQLYRQVIRPKPIPLPIAESLRQQLLSSNQTIHLRELGAGSSVNSSYSRKVSSIARHSLTPARFSALLSRLAQFCEAKYILELGTSFGINTLYLAEASPAGIVHTLEGCPQTAALATHHFKQAITRNIKLYTGNIDDLLPKLLQKDLPCIDLAYLDANHTYEATLRYFRWLLPHLHGQSVVVVDDIHWSSGMQQAWQELCAHPSVTLSLDVFEAGLLFFRPGMQKQQYVVEF